MPVAHPLGAVGPEPTRLRATHLRDSPDHSTISPPRTAVYNPEESTPPACVLGGRLSSTALNLWTLNTNNRQNKHQSVPHPPGPSLTTSTISSIDWFPSFKLWVRRPTSWGQKTKFAVFPPFSVQHVLLPKSLPGRPPSSQNLKLGTPYLQYRDLAVVILAVGHAG